MARPAVLIPGTALVILGALSGCRHDPFGLDEWRDFAQAALRWEAARPVDYSFELRIGCFCINALPIFTRIEVRGDTVAAATPVGATQGFPAIPLSLWPTVPQLFDRLRNAATLAEGVGVVTEVNARYDPVYGYPTLISVSCTDDVTDCGEYTQARNLQPLP